MNCDIESQFCLTVSIPNVYFESGKIYASFRMEAPSTVGWMAFGIGKNMVGSYMVMAWPRANGGAIISQRIAKGHEVPIVTEHQDDITLDPSSGIQSNKFVVLFKRPLSVNGSLITTDTTNYIWAIHDAERPDEDPNTMKIERHNAIGKFDITIDTPIPYDPTATATTDTITEATSHDTFIFIHGLTMFASWGFVVPGGVFISRFARNILPKRWFALHWSIQTFGALPLSITGIIMAYLAGVKFNIESRHHAIGAILTCCLFIQLLIGAIHHHLYSPERKYTPWWTKVHWWFGRSIIILAFIQIPIGLNIFNVAKAYIVGYYIYTTVIIVAYVTLSIVFLRKGENKIGSSTVSYTEVRQDDADFKSK
nr:3380_t:CDS:2 [Entrophospora candida]